MKERPGVVQARDTTVVCRSIVRGLHPSLCHDKAVTKRRHDSLPDYRHDETERGVSIERAPPCCSFSHRSHHPHRSRKLDALLIQLCIDTLPSPICPGFTSSLPSPAIALQITWLFELGPLALFLGLEILQPNAALAGSTPPEAQALDLDMAKHRLILRTRIAK